MAIAKDSNLAETIAATDAQLRFALDLGLRHIDARAGMGAVLGALATLPRDVVGDEAVEMAETVLMALVYHSAEHREEVHRWYAQRRGCRPDDFTIATLDLERQVQIALGLYRRTEPRLGLVVGSMADQCYPTIPIGVEGIAEFRSAYLVPHFGEASPSVKKLEQWFGMIGRPRVHGGMTVPGLVGRILHRVRPQEARRDSLSKTVQRVDRVLREHANLLK